MGWVSDTLVFFCYTVALQGCGSAIIAGGIQFAIAYGMYAHSEQPIILWAFPNTLSGDCALSLFIQVGVTWVTVDFLVGWDCYRGVNIPIPKFLKRYEPSKYMYAYLEVSKGSRHFGTTSPSFKTFVLSQINYSPERKLYYNFLIWCFCKVFRAMLFAVPVFLVVWSVTMGILAGIGHPRGHADYTFAHYWTPQVLKLVYGAVIGVIVAPAATIVVLLRNYWHAQEQDEPQSADHKTLEDN